VNKNTSLLNCKLHCCIGLGRAESKYFHLWWVGLGWVGSVSWWVGFDRVTQNGPMDNSGIPATCYSRRRRIAAAPCEQGWEYRPQAQSCPWVGLTHGLGWVEIFPLVVGWVGLGQSADGLGWIGSHEMDPWTTLSQSHTPPSNSNTLLEQTSHRCCLLRTRLRISTARKSGHAAYDQIWPSQKCSFPRKILAAISKTWCSQVNTLSSISIGSVVLAQFTLLTLQL